jgi:hypothetical protein
VSPCFAEICTKIQDNSDTVVRHLRMIVISAFVEGGFICGGCFFGGNETSDAGESPICVSGFSGTFIPLIYRVIVRGFFSRHCRSFARLAKVF